MSDVQVEDLGMELTKKKKKSSSKKSSKDKDEVNEEELSTIASEASQLFDANSKKKKKKKVAKKEETMDHTDEDIGDLIESLKKPKKASKKSVDDDQDGDDENEEAPKSTKGSYWVEDEKKTDAAPDVEFETDDDKTKEDFGPASWNLSDRDYKYEELLELMYNVLRNKNPGLGVKRSKIRVKPPKVMKDGPRKTIFINFQEICSNLHRQQEHVIAYIFSELSTSGSVAAGQQLIIRGVYRDKDIESVLKKYISDYVLCRVCNSMETVLTRDPNTRLYTLNCLSCGANRTVLAVKQSSATVKRSK